MGLCVCARGLGKLATEKEKIVHARDRSMLGGARSCVKWEPKSCCEVGTKKQQKKKTGGSDSIKPKEANRRLMVESELIAFLFCKTRKTHCLPPMGLHRGQHGKRMGRPFFRGAPFWLTSLLFSPLVTHAQKIFWRERRPLSKDGGFDRRGHSAAGARRALKVFFEF